MSLSTSKTEKNGERHTIMIFQIVRSAAEIKRCGISFGFRKDI
jgi:hypothetical protein